MYKRQGELLLTQFWNHIQRWFASPVFPGDENKTRRAYVVNYSINVILILALLTMGGGIVGGKTPGLVILIDGLILLGCLSLRFWLQRGDVALVSVGMTAICFVGLFFASAMLGTVRTPTTMGFIILVVFGGLVFDRRGLMAITSACLLAVAGLMIAENSHLLPVPDYSITITQWVTFLAVFTWVGSLIFVTHDVMQRALAQATQELRERQRVEDALRTSEANLRAVFNATNGAIFLLASDQTLLDLNEMAAQHLGHPREELIGCPMSESIPPDIYARRLPFVQRAFATGKPVSFEEVHNEHLAACYLHPILNDQGQTVRFVVHCTDITEQKQTEEALRKSEQRFSTIFHASPMPIIISNLQNGNYIDVNEAASRLLGYSPTEMLGHSAAALNIWCNLQDRHKLVSLLRTQGWVSNFETQCRTKSGEIKDLICAAELVVLGDQEHLLMLGYDITERKRLEQELHAQHEFALTVMNSLGQALVVTNAQGQFEYVNPAHAKLTGYAQQELLGGWRYDLNLPEELPVVQQAHQELKQGKPVQYETRIVRADKTIVPVLVSGTPRWREGKYAGTIAVITDLSQQKRTEEQLRYLGTHDALTSIYNRGFYETEMARLQNSRDYPISIIVADLDGMKMMNDTRGHDAGDQMLKHAAVVLQTAFRASDVVARIGGDEFAALLPKTDTGMAAQILERIRETQNAFNATNSDYVLNLSLGMATTHSGALIEAFKIADARMYQDKLRHKT